MTDRGAGKIVCANNTRNPTPRYIIKYNNIQGRRYCIEGIVLQ